MTAALLGVLIVLAGVVYYLSKQPAPSTAAAQAKTPTIVTFSTTSASTLTVSSATNKMEVQRNGTSWKLVQPIQGPADDTRIQGWLDQLGNLTADRVIKGKVDLATYGLTHPAFTVTVNLTGGKTVTLNFGDKTPDTGDYYVQIPKDPKVYLVNSSLGDDLKKAISQPPKAVPTPSLTPSPGALTPTATATG